MMKTDLTESDLLREPQLQDKIHTLETQINFPFMQNSISSKPLKKIQKKVNLILKIFSVVFLAQTFIRKLKNSIIFREKRKFLGNDPCFFPEGKRKSKSKTINNHIYSLFPIKETLNYLSNLIPLFDDSSKFIQVWNMFNLFFLVVTVIWAPLVLFKFYSISENTNLLHFLQFFFIFDVGFKLNQPLRENASIITDRKAILKHYLKFSFLVDALAISSLCIWSQLPDFALLFLLKLNQLFEGLRKIETIHLKSMQSKIVFTLMKCLLYTTLVAHYLACFWCHIGKMGEDYFTETWIQKNQIFEEIYINSFLFSFNILFFDGNNFIQPFNSLEIVCVIFFKIFAILNIMCVMKNLIFIFINIYETEKKFHEEAIIMSDFFKKSKYLSPQTKSKIFNFLEKKTQIEKKQVIKENQQKVLHFLPNNLINEIMFEMSKEINIEKVPLLRNNFTPDSLQKIALSFSKQKFYKGQIIFSRGEPNDSSLYYILKGKVSCSLPLNEEKLKIMTINEIFGLDQFFGNQPKNFTMEAITRKVVLLKLSREDFLKSLKKTQDFDKFYEIREKVQTQNNFEDMGIQCKICGSQKHPQNACQFFLSTFNKNLLLQKIRFSPDFNKRRDFKRNGKKSRIFHFVKDVINEKKGGHLKKNLLEQEETSEEARFLFASSEEIEMRNFDSRNLEFDKVDFELKENYFPHNHCFQIIREYNQRIEKRQFNSFFFDSRLINVDSSEN